MAGTVASEEVAQLYIRIENATVRVPQIELVSFRRVAQVPPGGKVDLVFTLAPEDHAILSESSDYASVIERGTRRVWISSSADPHKSPSTSASFAVAATDSATAPATPLHTCPNKGMAKRVIGSADAAKWMPPPL